MCLAVFGSSFSSAQKAENPSVFAIQAGAGIAGGVYQPGGISDDRDTDTSQVSRGAVWMFSYDYLVGKRFSVGGLIASQSLEVSSKLKATNTSSENGHILRTYIGFRGNWHYGKNDKIDLYSGFKIGIVNFNTTRVDNFVPFRESYIEAKNNYSRLAVGFTPIAARFFVSDNLGINLETSIGAPSFISIGMNYRM